MDEEDYRRVIGELRSTLVSIQKIAHDGYQEHYGHGAVRGTFLNIRETAKAGADEALRAIGEEFVPVHPLLEKCRELQAKLDRLEKAS